MLPIGRKGEGPFRMWGISLRGEHLMKSFKGTVALGGLTATVALLAGLSQAGAEGGAPGGGSFPQSFLVPGTNTSLAVYGAVKAGFRDQWGSMHTSDAGAPAGAASTAFPINQLALQGPGAAGGNQTSTAGQNAIHGGLRFYSSPSSVTFETRTPSNLGE